MPPNGPSATELYLTAINYNVAFSIGSVFSASSAFAHGIRLNFAAHAPEDIEEGIRRLGKAWHELQDKHVGTTQPAKHQASMQIL